MDVLSAESSSVFLLRRLLSWPRCVNENNRLAIEFRCYFEGSIMVRQLMDEEGT
jgi:hypothetical protein